MQITNWMVPCMPVDRKRQNIVVVVFFQKSAQFSNGDNCVQNFSYQLQTGFNRILKGWKCVLQTHSMFLIVRSKGAIILIFLLEFRKCNIEPFSGINGTV